MLKLKIKNKHNSLSPDVTKFCDLRKLSIICGKNGAGKSQLLTAIRDGDIQLYIESDGDYTSIPKNEIVYETLWSIKEKNINSPNFDEIDSLPSILKQSYKNNGDTWNFRFGAFNNEYDAMQILENCGDIDIKPDAPYDDKKVKKWIERTFWIVRPFQVDRIAGILLDYHIKILEENTEEGRNSLRSNAPWNQLNELLHGRAGLNFTILEPEKGSVRNPQRYIPQCKNAMGDIFNVTELSDGEKVLLTIATSMLSAENKSLNALKVLLLDEVDATLHPSMIQNLLKLLKDAFVCDYNIHVILVTHSPSTVALAADDELYYMQYNNDSRLIKSTKDKILKELAYGIPTLSVAYINRRNVIVESENDAKWMDRLYRIIQGMELISSEISLNFISSGKSGTSESGNCDNVKNIVKSFNDIESVIGIIDKDTRGDGSPSGIFILTQGERYSLENLLLDPVWVINFFRNNSVLNIYQNSKYNFVRDGSDIQHNVNMFIDNIKSKLMKLPESDKKEQIEYTNGCKIMIPLWYLRYNGHDLEKAIVNTYVELNKNCRNDNDLINKIVSELEQNISCVPISLIGTFENLLLLKK